MRNNPHTISLKTEPQPMPEPPTTPPAPPSPPRRPRRRGFISSLLINAVVLALIAGGAYAWWSWDDWFAEESAPADVSAEETSEEIADIVTRVGELIVLPEGEEPTIATVTDPAKLRDQVFFANAKEGDVVLIYTQAQKAYLYDPRIHKLLEVAPLTIQ